LIAKAITTPADIVKADTYLTDLEPSSKQAEIGPCHFGQAMPTA
jgi:hypothetical protein